MKSRRNFLKWSGISIPLFFNHKTHTNWHPERKRRKPVVVATWDSGLPVCQAAWEVLQNKDGTALDAVESGARSIESKQDCCVGLDGNPDREGKVTLDACIMDHEFNCGSVAFLERIRHPISVARKVMEDTPHVMLVGDGAQQFAVESGFPLEPDQLSESAKKAYQKWLKKSEYKPVINIEKKQGSGPGAAAPRQLPDGSLNHDTMGLVALDASENLAGACTTSGMGFKMRGRVGDSPIIGSGLYVDNEIGAVTATGQGEEIIRIAGAHAVVEFMRNGKSPQKACAMAIERIININPQKAREFQACFLALDKYGRYGAYAIQPGFVYSVRHAEEPGVILNAPSYYG